MCQTHFNIRVCLAHNNYTVYSSLNQSIEIQLCFIIELRKLINCSVGVSWPLVSGDGKLSITSYTEVMEVPRGFICSLFWRCILVLLNIFSMIMFLITKLALLNSTRLLPLMYIFMTSVTFCSSSNHFKIHPIISISRPSSNSVIILLRRSSSCNKLEHVFTLSNQQRNFYFNRLPRTFNLTQPFVTTSTEFQLTKFTATFTRNFDPDNQHSFHFTCPLQTSQATQF